MNKAESRAAHGGAKALETRLALPVALMALQIVAAAYFVIDGVEDQFLEGPAGSTWTWRWNL
ncbi:MAG: hypothetical protein ABL932_09510 [Terricaulis sp.]